MSSQHNKAAIAKTAILTESHPGASRIARASITRAYSMYELTAGLPAKLHVGVLAVLSGSAIFLGPPSTTKVMTPPPTKRSGICRSFGTVLRVHIVKIFTLT